MCSFACLAILSGTFGIYQSVTSASSAGDVLTMTTAELIAAVGLVNANVELPQKVTGDLGKNSLENLREATHWAKGGEIIR